MDLRGLRAAFGSALGSRGGGTSRGPVPVLVYHRISGGDEPAEAEVPAVAAAEFARQIAYLAAEGYGTVSLLDLTAGAPCRSTERAVAITFDDGWGSTRSRALPVLQQHGMTASVFVTTDPAAGVFDPARQVDPPLRQFEWCELAEAGWEIGSHTHTHPPLTECSDERLEDEIVRSRSILEAATGQAANFLAAPFGLSDLRVREAARRAGHVGLCPGATGLSHWGQPALLVRRIGIPAGGGLPALRRSLTTSGARAAQVSGAVKTLTRRVLGHENSMRLRRALLRVRLLAGSGS